MNSIYIKLPKNNPIKIYNLSSPLLNKKVLIIIKAPEIIQKHISSKYVKKSGVLKVFLNTLKISNIILIVPPTIIKIMKEDNWFKLFVYNLLSPI